MKECNTLHTHDVFRFRGLGKSALEVWEVLGDGDATVKEISKITGRHPSTVGRVLKEIAGIEDIQTGELIRMVVKRDQKWHRLEVDLERVAEIIGIAGIGQQQREKHRKERERYRRILDRRWRD